MRRALRMAAVLIAMAAAIDPAMTVSGRGRLRVAIVAAHTAPDAQRVRGQLESNLRNDFDIVGYADSETAAAIVIDDRYRDLRDDSALISPTFAGAVSTVSLALPRIRIAQVAAPREIPPATTVRLVASVDADESAGQTTDVEARIGGVELARASHRWTMAHERWQAVLEVVPFGDPPFAIRINAAGSAVDVAVGVRRRPRRVLVHDARPSWASTFTRRALESDPRFQVETTMATARTVTAATAGAPQLADAALNDFDAVIAGGLDALSAADARALDRYVRDRGGAAIFLADQKVVGPVAELFAAASERLLEQPATLTAPAAAALRASELLLFGSVAASADVLARTPGANGEPVVVSVPHGSGRLLLSGAMDAWRYRAQDDGAFDRFWQAAVAGTALATPPPIDVEVRPAILAPGEVADVIVRLRAAGPGSRVSARVDGRPFRLWPDAGRGVYRGRFTAEPVSSGRSAIDARAADDRGEHTAMAPVLVRESVAPAAEGRLPLALLAAAHGGIDVAPDRIGELVSFIRTRTRAPSALRTVHPMRSGWWLAAFAASLSGEWWLRRRRGLR